MTVGVSLLNEKGIMRIVIALTDSGIALLCHCGITIYSVAASVILDGKTINNVGVTIRRDE
jgi:hypothetical protein